MYVFSLNLVILILFVGCAVSSVLETNEKEEQLRHEIVKRGLFWPQLLFPLNAATGK